MDKNNKFEVTGGKIVITDPCYERSDVAAILDAHNGTWEGSFEIENGRVRSIIVELAGPHPKGDRAYKHVEVGVDSGQAGVFNEALYPVVLEGVDKHNGETSPFNYDVEDSFYKRQCNQTYDENDRNAEPAGASPEGYLSSSDYGDGTYDCEVALVDGKAVRVEITFIEEEYEEEDDYGEDEYGDEDE